MPSQTEATGDERFSSAYSFDFAIFACSKALAIVKEGRKAGRKAGREEGRKEGRSR